MYDTGYGGKSIGYGRDRISDFPMRKPSGRGMRIPISDDVGFGFIMIFMSLVGIFAITLFWKHPIVWFIAFCFFASWFVEWEETNQLREEEEKEAKELAKYARIAEEERKAEKAKKLQKIKDDEKRSRDYEDAKKLALIASKGKDLSLDVETNLLFKGDEKKMRAYEEVKKELLASTKSKNFSFDVLETTLLKKFHSESD